MLGILLLLILGVGGFFLFDFLGINPLGFDFGIIIWIIVFAILASILVAAIRSEKGATRGFLIVVVGLAMAYVFFKII